MGQFELASALGAAPVPEPSSVELGGSVPARGGLADGLLEDPLAIKTCP